MSRTVTQMWDVTTIGAGIVTNSGNYCRLSAALPVSQAGSNHSDVRSSGAADCRPIRRRRLLGRHNQAPRRIASCFRLPLKLSVRLARSDGERDGTSPRIWAVGHFRISGAGASDERVDRRARVQDWPQTDSRRSVPRRRRLVVWATPPANILHKQESPTILAAGSQRSTGATMRTSAGC